MLRRTPTPSKLHGTEDVLELLERLPSVRLGTEYTETDRARDFLKVFTTEEGRRVLAQLNLFCNPNPNPSDSDKPGRLAFKEGQRWVLAEIMRCFVSQKKIPEIEDKKHGSR